MNITTIVVSVLLVCLYFIGMGLYVGVCTRIDERDRYGNWAGPLSIGGAVWPVMLVVIPLAYIGLRLARIGSRQ